LSKLWLVVGVGACLPIVFMSTAQAQISVLPRAAKFNWTVNNKFGQAAAIDGQLLPNGKVKYTGSFTAPEGAVLSVNYTVDPTNNPTASITGQVTVANNSPVPLGIDAQISIPLCPDIPGGTLLGGNASLKVTTNVNGGALTCLPGEISLYQVHIGDTVANNLFWCPIRMSTSGAGTMQTSVSYGAPVPSLPGPNSAPNAGIRTRLTITDNDSVIVSSTLLIKTLGQSTGCVGDLNGDGAVDASDLSALLGVWGQAVNPCSSVDFDGDGVVNASDMAVLLAKWGPCPN